MTKPNKQEILDCINNMKAVCADGRKEIKGLVEKIIGEPLGDDGIVSFKSGDVFESGLGSILIPIQYGACSFIFLGLACDPLVSYSNEPRSRDEVISHLRGMEATKVGHLKVEIIKP